MKEISLTQGKVALVDDGDFDWLNHYTWHALKTGYTFYASTSIFWNGKHKNVYMHRLLLDIPSGFDTDHRDSDGLNNTRANLRVASRSLNNANSRKRKGTTSKYKGVSWKSDKGKWRAQIRLNRWFYLGCFVNEIEAALAYNKAALEHFGEFAKLNPIPE